MSRETWNTIKRTKRFYVNTYRRAGTALFLSMLTNLGLGAGIYYTYFNQPDNDYYATSGITPPVQLTSMDEPNNTSTPLLANDTDETDDNKVIPQ